MRNSLLFVFCLMMLLMSCSQETDYAISGVENEFLNQSMDYPSGPISSVTGADREGTCVDLVTTQWLNGTGIFQPVQKIMRAEITKYPAQPKSYFISAYGEAISEVYSRGLTELTMQLTTSPYKLSGTLTTRFYFGEVLELELGDVVNVQIDEQGMQLTASIRQATFSTASATFDLDQGEIIFDFPITTEGSFAFEAITYSKLCTF